MRSGQVREETFRRMLVLGPGVMGAGTAVAFARAGFEVSVWSRSQEGLSRGRRRIERSIQSISSSFDLTEDEAVETGRRIAYSRDLGTVAQAADFVVEAVVEDLAVKSELLRCVDVAAPPHAVLATETSGLSITALGRATERPDRVVGTHFWNPPELMPLVEVVRGEDTSHAVVDIARRLVHRIGKVPVTVHKDAAGFIGNRMLHALWREAISIVERGIADAADVDTVARLTFGLRSAAVGPLENMDLVGLDLIHAIHRYLLPELERSEAPNRLLARQVGAGELGFKSGRGFYDWSDRDPAELVEARNAEITRQLRRLREEGILP